MRSYVEFRGAAAEFELEIERAAEQGLFEAAEVVRAAVAARETRVGTKPSPVSPGVHLRDTFRTGRVKHRGGLSFIEVYSADPNAIWQNAGTRSRRKKPLKRQRANTQANRGVAPLRFFEQGLRDAWPAALELIARRMPGRAP